MSRQARLGVPQPQITGQIHQQGYERYTGTRRDQASRFWIVARNTAGLSVKRVAMILSGVASILILMISAAYMFIVNSVIRSGRLPTEGVPKDPLVGVIISPAIGGSAIWWLGWWGMVIAATFGCSAVADDLKVGAFQFYFSRSLRSLDYALGKAIGVLILVGVPMFFCPVLLALLRLAFVSNTDELAEVWTIVPKTIAFAFITTLAYGLPAIGLGAAIAHKRGAQAAYIAYYMLVGVVVTIVAIGTKIPQIELIAFDHACVRLGVVLFELPLPKGLEPLPWWQPALAVAGYIGLGTAGMVYRAQRAEVSAVGGGS